MGHDSDDSDDSDESDERRGVDDMRESVARYLPKQDLVDIHSFS